MLEAAAPDGAGGAGACLGQGGPAFGRSCTIWPSCERTFRVWAFRFLGSARDLRQRVDPGDMLGLHVGYVEGEWYLLGVCGE
eukprot:12090236-Ditylum_brightwellii.AAC.1